MMAHLHLHACSVERCSQGSARTQKLIHSHIQELQVRNGGKEVHWDG